MTDIYEMPIYKCHKEVRALKIKKVVDYPTGITITPVDDMYGPIVVLDKSWMHRYKPTPVDEGYYVVYEDGYASWSPTKAFEEGYTRI